ncbi:hypothetical protein RB195_007813 [Necator americanus]|uniref:Uncharacterized protein n=1 Tax=Necator americanus TaxID=51031 RepID=A0ABR1C1Q0_NECAM
MDPDFFFEYMNQLFTCSRRNSRKRVLDIRFIRIHTFGTLYLSLSDGTGNTSKDFRASLLFMTISSFNTSSLHELSLINVLLREHK